MNLHGKRRPYRRRRKEDSFSHGHGRRLWGPGTPQWKERYFNACALTRMVPIHIFLAAILFDARFPRPVKEQRMLAPDMINRKQILRLAAMLTNTSTVWNK